MTDFPLGQYNYPGDIQTWELWYPCLHGDDEVYLLFDHSLRSQFDIPPALEFASKMDAKGVIITRTEKTDYQREFRVCEFKPQQPRFNSDIKPDLK
jgi:hypothetical protein